MAALSSGSSSSSLARGTVFITPFAFPVAFICRELERSCGMYAAGLSPLASSRLISSARLRSASKLSSMRASRGCIEPCHRVLLGDFGLSNLPLLRDTNAGNVFERLFSVIRAWQPSSTRTGWRMPRCGKGIFFEEQAPQKTLPQLRQWCFRLVNVKGVRQRMQTSESAHSGGCGVPKRCQLFRSGDWERGSIRLPGTYRTTIEHAAGHVLSWGKSVSFPLEGLICFADIYEIVSPFNRGSPGLY